MPQQTLWPTRQGLSLPRGENLLATEILSEGGLDLTQSILETRPGFASELVNFEVSLTGGYRRISGFAKYSTTIVPGQGQTVGVAVYIPGAILAARIDAINTLLYNVYTGTGTTWTKINGATNLTYAAGTIVNNTSYNWTGTYRIVLTDGLNPAYKWDGTTFTLLNGAGSAADPKYAMEFNGYLFVGGYSSNYGAIKCCAPLVDTDWATVNGAAEIVVGDTVTGFGVWRQQLIVFCRNSIFRIVGNSTDTTSATPFTKQQVSDRVGCLDGRSIQEINGDLVFLAQDGLRTISGTFKIGDTEIGSISRPVQSIVSGIDLTSTPCHSLVIRKKNQYRLFYSNSTQSDTQAMGVIGGVRRFRDGHEDWEFGQLQGIRPACCASGYWASNVEYVVHGGYDGYVYKQESGGTFNGSALNERYTTVPLEFGDRGIRKVIQRVSLYITVDAGSSAAPNLYLSIIYDLGAVNHIQPLPILLTNIGSAVTLYDSGALYGSGVVYDVVGSPLFRQNVQGSGFLGQLRITSPSSSQSYTIQGFLIEYFAAARR